MLSHIIVCYPHPSSLIPDLILLFRVFRGSWGSGLCVGHTFPLVGYYSDWYRDGDSNSDLLM